jgi:hypothetical protein
MEYIINSWAASFSGNFINIDMVLETTSITPVDKQTKIILSEDQFDDDSNWWIQVLEGQTDIKIIRQRQFEFKTPVQIIITVKELQQAEFFDDLKNILYELVGIVGQYKCQADGVFPMDGVSEFMLVNISPITQIGNIYKRIINTFCIVRRQDESEIL